MARASFTTLPPELKEKIVKMASDQEETWEGRRKSPYPLGEERFNGLSSLALVNKELRELAARHQFKVLVASQVLSPVFRACILRQHADHIVEVDFHDAPDFMRPGESYETALFSIERLPSLRTLRFSFLAATLLFGDGVTLNPDPTDIIQNCRVAILLSVAHRIETLTLTKFRPSAAVALIRACPNLTTLILRNLDLRDAVQAASKRGIWNTIFSIQKLSCLTLSITRGEGVDWLPDADSPLARDPPPIKSLQLLDFPFDRQTSTLISLLSSTLKRLSLKLKAKNSTLDVTSIPPLRLPLLTHLALSFSQYPNLPSDLHLFSSLDTLRHFSILHDDEDGVQVDLDPADPVLCAFLDSQPALQRLQLGRFELKYHNPTYLEASPFHPVDLIAYADLIRSRGLDPSVLDEPHVSPFHPGARLDYTTGELEYLTGYLDRALDFGRTELERMVSEGDVPKAVEWIQTLKSLEDKRLRSQY